MSHDCRTDFASITLRSVLFSRRSLVCKMGYEFDHFILSERRWWCHTDDDTYVNVQQLVALLATYNHTQDWYLGRPSLSHPIEVIDHLHTGVGFIVSDNYFSHPRKLHVICILYLTYFCSDNFDVYSLRYA